MSEESDSAPTMSIKDRIAALQKGKGGEETTIPIGPPPQKPKRSNALAGRIAALQQQTGDKTTNESGDDNNDVANKVGKLKLPPPGGVPIIMPGGGPPPSLLRKQKEREERKQKMVEEAQKDDSQSSENDATTKEESSSSSATVGKLKLPPGAIKVIVPGCPPPAMLKKTDVDKILTAEDASSEAIAATSDEALLSRPTMPKRKPRSRG